jgi:hypothetical protein
MDIRRVGVLVCFFGVAALTGCGAMQKQVEETKARGTVETGGYTWNILAESEGGNTISTNGLPSRQHATDASAILCKKNGRIPQFGKQTGFILLGIQQFEFNCVK